MYEGRMTSVLASASLGPRSVDLETFHFHDLHVPPDLIPLETEPMTKKKKSQAAEHASSEGSAASASPTAPPKSSKSLSNGSKASSKPSDPSTSSLIICRNKHWRYISSFHGPWLQLPPEVLESLAHNNYFSPRPRPIDPAVFFDLVKIRRAVDDATNLAVRAASGLTSAALNSSMNAGNGMMGGAHALGLGYSGGANTKMSKGTKHRMREMATQKLSQAYHLDEIAASVATMQSTSTLEDVAKSVLDRQTTNAEAKYVHFFHEKIPSRMMAQCTSLEPLSELIADQPLDGSPLRTRALTRIFKDDYQGAARDLSEGLAIARYWDAQHRQGKDQLILAREAQEQMGRDWRHEARVKEEDQPNSLEMQMLFHRAGAYFTIACQHVRDSLDGLEEAEAAKKAREAAVINGDEPIPLTAVEKEAHKARLEARKAVKQNAKRALRDYTTFLSHFDYTPGIPPDIAEEFLERMNKAANGKKSHKPPSQDALVEEISNEASAPTSSALVQRKKESAHPVGHSHEWPHLPAPEIFQVSQLFAPAPPATLPPFPADTNTIARPSRFPAGSAASLFAESQETVTYHPLLTDALHSLLLCHSLLQTPPKELLRHAHNVARLARVCDGYPVFLAARSPARADWIEVLRRAGNWIGVTSSWETLCKPAPLPSAPGKHDNSSSSSNGAEPETPQQKRDRQKHEAILDALADERVVDEDSFQKAVRAREIRLQADEDMEKETAQAAASNGHAPGAGVPVPKRWAQEDGKEYPISTERADAISRWVREAPLTVEGAKSRSKKKGKGKSKGKREGLAESVGTLSTLSVGEGEVVD